MLPDLFGELNELLRVLLSAIFIVIAAAVSRWQRAGLERDLAVATIRSFVQLILIGYALELIFNQNNPLFTIGILAVMITIASITSGARVKQLPGATWIAAAAISVAALLTVGLLVTLGVFRFTPHDIIPIGGMIVGNSMNVATLVISRLADDVRVQRLVIESQLALGATSRQASMAQFRRAIRSAMTPVVDSTKSVGLITLPGAMTGMILAGASPLEAVRLQIIVMYMIVGAATFASLIAAFLTVRQFFTPHHQLKPTPHDANV